MAIAVGTPVASFTSGLQTTVTDYVGPFATPARGPNPNPNRLYLLVFFSNTTGRISPAPGSDILGFGADVAGVAGGRLLHKASYPGLVEGEWFLFDSAGGTIRIYDVEVPR